MGVPLKSICLLIGLLHAAVAAQASEWFTLNSGGYGPGSTVVEVDLSTIRLRAGTGEAVIRVSHDPPQVHAGGFTYRSFIATAQIECQRQSVSLVSAAYFAQPGGQGSRVAADSSGRESGMPTRLLESIPAHARQALLRAACAAGHGP
jgi:hypothetical protein